MEGGNSQSQDPNFKELYTIPSDSRWFSWDDIHQVERYSLKEFFDASSITRTPKIYKEYRDFIISKYREDPNRRLTFSEVRKALVGDISLIHKVFVFLESWNLINFNAPKREDDDDDDDDYVGGEDKWNVRVEEGAPYGVKVVANPNSLKPVLPPPVSVSGGGIGGIVSPLASFKDRYGELVKKKLVCGNCKGSCESGCYEYSKDRNFLICLECFKSENYGEKKAAGDFKFQDCTVRNGNFESAWSEAETLLLLESVLKYGDDWEVVAQHVQTKSKLDCISKLIQLPFGELMFGAGNGKPRLWDTGDSISSVNQVNLDSRESSEITKTVKAPVSDASDDLNNENEQNGNAEDVTPPQKRLCTVRVSDSSNSLMKQVSRLSMMVGPHITSSASEAAVAALCYENLCPREIFEVNDDGSHKFGLSQHDRHRASPAKDSDMEERQASDVQDTSLTNTIPVALRMRAATATALGAAAARAKLLADQEDRVVEHQVATIIEMQVKKLQCKMRCIEDLELIMETEHGQMKKLVKSLLSKRMNVLKKIFSAGISRWGDRASVTAHAPSVP
ncbi:SWI/SNF complex subunit SWI3A [Heracleum sosnowskyi]|uniref:SWI/SNF complex subunit SWI3A n=1 Tax=Heracleum sosnowskyi TaxID=360622 RepID=A0AAD8I184_9APIA|nr:SWI/SNF complex subunit SWI3A [Heracleum sosnowskyi]